MMEVIFLKKAYIIFFILHLIFTNTSVYADETNLDYAAAQFSNFDEEIVIIANDLNSYISKMFSTQPELEFYYSGYSGSSIGNRHSVNFKYTNQNIDINKIHYIDTKDDFKTIIANNMLYCNDKVYIVARGDYTLENIVSEIVNDNQIISMGYKGFNASSFNSELTNNTCYDITLNYTIDREQLLSYKKTTEDVAITIISQALCKSMPDYHKEKIIHDYIVKHTDYSDENGELSYMAYDALVNGKGVCSAYATSIKIMLDLVGIENYYVSGTGTNSQGTENHGWNIVKLGDSYYNLDATWDDPVVMFGINDTRYDYFNITDAKLSNDHQWDKSLYPACNGTEYDYITVKNMINDDFSEYNDYYNKSDFVSVFDKYSLDKEENVEISTVNYTETEAISVASDNISNNTFIYIFTAIVILILIVFI